MNLPERVNGIMYIRPWHENKYYPVYYPATIETEIKKAVEFVEMPPFEYINQFYPTDKFIGIFRSIFSAISLWMIYFLMKRNEIDTSKATGI